MTEVWRNVAGYGGHYQVSNLGRVRSLGRFYTRTSRGRTFEQSVPAKILKANPGTNYGYLMLALCKDGRAVRKYVHCLVAEAFLGPRPPGMVVCHGPAGYLDCSVGNLKYGTQKDNASDRYRDGTDARGENNPMAVLNQEIVSRIKTRLATGLHSTAVAREFGLNRSTVLGIEQERNWAHIKV